MMLAHFSGFPPKVPSACNEPCDVLVMLAGREGREELAVWREHRIKVVSLEGSQAHGRHIASRHQEVRKISGDSERQTGFCPKLA